MLRDEDLTTYLIAWNRGDKAGRDGLLPLVYDELRRLAARYLRDERSADTLQPTALVHEAFLRLAAQKLPEWESRSHFFGVAAYLMRQVLIDHARRIRRAKRGGGERAASLDEAVNLAPQRGQELLALDDALSTLARLDPRKAEIIERRYFGGFTLEETAKSLAMPAVSVAREQRLAEAWLHRELMRGENL